MGAATSKDMCRWHDVVREPSGAEDDVARQYRERLPSTLEPAATTYDNLGVFDGTIIPRGYRGHPTLIYTAVRHLPTGFSLPYHPGTETLCLAYTTDRGRSWIRLPPSAESKRIGGGEPCYRAPSEILYDDGGDTNPIVDGPPKELGDVTGWRDPFVFTSSHLDRLYVHGQPATAPATSNAAVAMSTARKASSVASEETDSAGAPSEPTSPVTSMTSAGDDQQWYLAMASGEKTAGPRVLLYKQTQPGNYLDWTCEGPLFAPEKGSSWSEDWSGAFGHNFEVAAVSRLSPTGDASHQPSTPYTLDFITVGTEGQRDSHQGHWPLYAGGHITMRDGKPSFEPELVGVVNWGSVYAMLSFVDETKYGRARHILVGWVYEDVEYESLLKAQGWNGTLTHPVELYVNVVRHVTDERVKERGNWTAIHEADGSTTVLMLGARRLQELEDAIAADGGPARVLQDGFEQPETQHYELRSKIAFPEGDRTSQAGFTILADPESSERTVIFYDCATETIQVDRSRSSSLFTRPNEEGKIRLWETAQGRQELDITVLVDASIVTVYVNDVFALTTRVYPSHAESTNVGLWRSADSRATFGETTVREGLFNAWPDRPADTSLPLLTDDPEAPWPGY